MGSTVPIILLILPSIIEIKIHGWNFSQGQGLISKSSDTLRIFSPHLSSDIFGIISARAETMCILPLQSNCTPYSVFLQDHPTEDLLVPTISVQQRLSQMNIDKITLLIQYSNWKEKIRKKEDKKIPDHLPRHITHILDSRNKYYNESLHIRNYVLKSLCALCCSCKCRRASTDTVEV